MSILDMFSFFAVLFSLEMRCELNLFVNPFTPQTGLISLSMRTMFSVSNILRTTELSETVANSVHTTDKTVLSCLCWRCELGITVIDSTVVSHVISG